MKLLFACAAFALAMSWNPAHARNPEILGDVQWPEEWTVFAPGGIMAPAPPAAQLREIPDTLAIGDKTLRAQRTTPTNHQFDFGPMFGPVVERQTAFVFLPIMAPEAGRATLGFGADWWMQAWVNGELVLDTTDRGNDRWPPSIDNHLVHVNLRRGRNVLAVRFLSGTGSSVLALGGPNQLREPIPPSIVQQDARAEFEQMEAQMGNFEVQPTQGWAAEFRREVQQPGRGRVALRPDWGANLLEEAAVTFGVPFARGALPDVSRTRLVDAQGRNVPAQVEQTATWDGPNGPVRWALFHARLRRGEEYYVEYGSEVSRPAPQGVQVAENDRAIAVTTGPMRFVVSKTAPTVVHSAVLGRDGTYSAQNAIVTPEQSARAIPSVTDAEGNVYRASADGFKAEVVEDGPMRAAVRREGWYVGPDGTRFCQFITYTYFMAGDAGFQHDHTLVVAFNTHDHQIRDIEIPVPLNLRDERRAWFAADGSAEGSLIEQTVGTEPISLVEHYREGWRLLRGDEPAANGERSGGWFGLADSRWGAFAGIEHFWQNSPAELEVAGNRMNLHLWASRETELLDFRPSRILGDRGEDYPGDRVFHSRWYRDGLDEMTQGFGTAKTHSLHFRFFSEPERETAARQARAVAEPVFAYPDPEWACRTEAFGRVWHYDPERFPEKEAILDAIAHRRLWLRERLDNYGWFHFGDVNGNLSNPGDPERITFSHWRRWASMFYGNPNVMPNLFLRSGRRDAWDFHRANTRHIFDIDICNLDNEELGKTRGLRYGGNGGIVHFAANLYDLGCDTHLRFALYDYYLNGDLRTWEAANFYMEGQAALRTRPSNLRFRHRHTGGPLRFFAEAYQATWDPEYLSCMRQFAEILLQAKEELGVTRYCDVYMNEGKVFYYQATGDERMRDLFLSDMGILRRKRDAHVFEDTRSTTLYGLSHAYWFTGDNRFLPFALWQLNVAKQGTITEGDPGRIGSINWALEFAYNATLANQLPTMMAALVDAGEPLPRPGGPSISETSGALHFLQEEDGEVEIAVRTSLYTGVARAFRNWRAWMDRLPEDAQPALALVGPDGREIQRISLAEEAERQLPGDHEARIAGGAVPADVTVFRHPADGQTGVYTVEPTSLAVPLRLGLFASNIERWVVDPQDAAVSGDPYVPYYFQVPAGTGQFSVRFKTSALRGDQKVEVFDEDGNKQAEVQFSGGRRAWQTIQLDAGRPNHDQAWLFYVFPKTDLFLDFDGVPGLLASSPETLFAPDRRFSAPMPEAPEGASPSYGTEDGLGGAPAAVLPARARVSVASPEEGRALATPEQGTVEMWVKCHRRPDEVADRRLVTVGGLRIYRRAAVGTYISMPGGMHQTGMVLPPGRWAHLAATWKPHADGGLEVALYIDGVYVTSPYSRRIAAEEGWPGDAIAIPRGEAGLSIAGLRVSSTARYEGNFGPLPGPPRQPDADTLALWPVNTEGEAWVLGRTAAPR